jgi:hypothetical protein
VPAKPAAGVKRTLLPTIVTVCVAVGTEVVTDTALTVSPPPAGSTSFAATLMSVAP